jgi:hypothetical protein
LFIYAHIALEGDMFFGFALLVHYICIMCAHGVRLIYSNCSAIFLQNHINALMFVSLGFEIHVLLCHDLNKRQRLADSSDFDLLGGQGHADVETLQQS